MSEFSVYRGSGNILNRSSKTHKEYEKNEARERKKNLLYLIHSYLRDCNLHDSADVLSQEAQLINQYEVCDNIDLDIMLQDYQDYYMTKFNKIPKIIKKINTGTVEKADDNKITKKKPKPPQSSSSIPSLKQPKQSQSGSNLSEKEEGFQIDVRYLSVKPLDESEGKVKEENVIETLRPVLCDFEGYSPEWREMADLITKEIVPKKLGLAWKDCVGLKDSVDLLKEAVIYPLKYPNFFTGLLTPWKGVLLYGPPGTGKTHLAKALAGEASTAFINLTISTFVSKWRGDSEKMLKVLFDIARLYAPSTIFIDELDAIASKYEDHQHDASRRFKSELLIQLDGILGGNNQVFVLATTNVPWNLNTAILRRFEKRILLNVPTIEARRDLFRYYFCRQRNEFTDADFDCMAQITDNFSGADIKLVCKEVLMVTLREKLNQIADSKQSKQDNTLRKPTLEDVKKAVKKFHPTSTVEVINKYAEWANKYGSL